MVFTVPPSHHALPGFQISALGTAGACMFAVTKSLPHRTIITAGILMGAIAIFLLWGKQRTGKPDNLVTQQ